MGGTPADLKRAYRLAYLTCGACLESDSCAVKRELLEALKDSDAGAAERIARGMKADPGMCAWSGTVTKLLE